MIELFIKNLVPERTLSNVFDFEETVGQELIVPRIIGGTIIGGAITINPFKVDREGNVTGVGGLYGVNVETLTGNKTLTINVDKIYQYLDPDGSDRVITLVTSGAIAGNRFIIRHNGSYNDAEYLQVKQSTITLDKIYAGSIKKFIFDGTNWVTEEIGTGENHANQYNISIGSGTKAYDAGIAIGGNIITPAIGYTGGVGIGQAADGNTYGVGIGAAQGNDYGVAIGYATDGHSHGVAIGAYATTQGKAASVALGHKARCERSCEISKRIEDPDRPHTYKNNIVIAGWYKQTSDENEVEIFLAEISDARFTISAKSSLTFTIHIAAMRSNYTGVAAYKFEGCITRDDSNNTTLEALTKTVIFEDDANWDATVEADDTNEALIIKVTGVAATSIQWTARLDGVETSW